MSNERAAQERIEMLARQTIYPCDAIMYGWLYVSREVDPERDNELWRAYTKIVIWMGKNGLPFPYYLYCITEISYRPLTTDDWIEVGEKVSDERE